MYNVNLYVFQLLKCVKWLVKHKGIQVELYATESPKPRFVKWIIILLANISQLNNYYKKVYFHLLPTLHFNNIIFYIMDIFARRSFNLLHRNFNSFIEIYIDNISQFQINMYIQVPWSFCSNSTVVHIRTT